MTKENWKAVPGYEGLYEVSDQGNVRSVDRVVERIDGKLRRFKSKVLRPDPGTNGYHTVSICAEGKPRKMSVHHLVLEAFVGPRPPGLECRHLDGNQANNHASNLSWGTRAENFADRARHGSDQRAGDKQRAVTNLFNVRCIRQMAKLGIVSQEIARCFAINRATVSNILHGKKGYDRFA